MGIYSHGLNRSTMRSPAVVIATVLVSLVAVSQSGVISDSQDQIVPFSIIDPIIKAILEGMRPKLANIKIPDINETVKNPTLNASVLVKDILIQNADRFEIKVLKSNIVPLKLTNLTLALKNVTASAKYDLNASAKVTNTPTKLFAKGNARATLYDLFFTIGANVDLKNGAIQIKPRGLFGFDLRIRRANVTLTSLMGSADFGEAVGTFVSKIIPDLVDTLKKPLFEAFQDDIINVVNDVLKNNGTKYEMDDEYESEEFSSEEGSFMTFPLQLDSEESNFQPEF